MTKTYKKLEEEGKYQVIETKEEISVIDIKFIEEDIAHKDKLIADLQIGIANLEEKKAELIKLRDNLLKAK